MTGGWLSDTKLLDEVEVLVDAVPLLLKVVVAIATELIAAWLDCEPIAPLLAVKEFSTFVEVCKWSTRNGMLALVDASIPYFLCSRRISCWDSHGAKLRRRKIQSH